MTTTDKTREENLQDVGKCAYEAIAEMVAALQADRERLEELRDERDGFEPDEDTEPTWAEENPGEAEELAELIEAVTLDGAEVDEDAARQRIDEDPLSLRIFGERVDGEWEATNYELLLTTGGPAVRIVGEIDGEEASSARLEVQDWFTPWTEYVDADEDVLIAYASCFYFG